MTEPPRRKRFQFHLSTAIVMMFVAGGLIWLNMSGSSDDTPLDDFHGWPLTGMHRFAYDSPRDRFQNLPGIENGGLEWRKYRIYPSAIIDFIVALTILFAVWFLCEWVIRRRAARKGC